MKSLATDRIALERYSEARRLRVIHQCRLADEKFVKTVFHVERARRRGGSDRYYGRKYSPAVLVGHLGQTRPAYTPSEIAGYKDGWDNETDKKEW